MNSMDEKQIISVIPYAGGGDLLTDARTIIDGARQYAYSAVNVALVQRNCFWGSVYLKKNSRRTEKLTTVWTRRFLHH